MNDLLLIPIAVLYLIVVSLLFTYGVNFFYLTILGLRKVKEKRQPQTGDWPHVTVQLPIYNERYVAERLVKAAAAFDYPPDKIEIQVLDDSTDDTIQIVSRLVRQLSAAGKDVVHIHRRDRTGYKAGALANGMVHSKGEFLVIFDADFIPGRDFLRRTIPAFQDSEVAFVQTRWGHVNREYSFLTLLQSIAIDAHFMIEQAARYFGGYWFNFNGTAGVWRKTAIEQAGGWKADTLTEDLDLSYRAFLNGWRAVYMRDVEVPAELPVAFSAYRRQQNRWARGSLECAYNLIPQVWRQPISLAHKIEASLHLTGYGVHLLLFALSLLYPLIISLVQEYAGLLSLFGLAAFFNLTAFAPTLFFLAAQKQLGPHWWRKIPTILFITVLGTGMMLNTTRAAIQAFGNGNRQFERTPKFGIQEKGETWLQKQYQLKLDPIVFFELFFAVFNFRTMVNGFEAGNWVVAIYAGIFGAGLLFAAGISVAQELGRWRASVSRPAVN